jgi:rhodanese-related sulfurtransferase
MPAEFSMSTPNRFQKLVQEAKTRITEISAPDAAREIERGTLLIDVREPEDRQQGHVPAAVHMPRGTIELDIEEKVPDLDTPIICHCGGGSRSALVAESLQRMGYTNVKSLAGGFKAWKQAGLPTSGPTAGAGASGA